MNTRQARRLRLAVSYPLLLVWALVCLFPIYWLVVTSLKQPIAVSQGPRYLPGVDFQPTLDAWRYLFGPVRNEVVRSWTNSAILAFTSALLAVAIGSLAGYALTRFRFRVPGLRWRNNDIAFWIISQRMLPPVVVILPFLIMYRFLGLLDTHPGMILAYTVFNLPLVVWIMRDFFAGLPVDLEESALIDGASRLQAFRQIVLPLSAPGLVATFLVCLVFSWNDYLFALMLTFSNASTMPMYIAGQNNSYGPQWWYLSALCLLAIAPMLVVALLLERFITRGLLIGSIK
jgi:multiple sugar transport system permease protein